MHRTTVLLPEELQARAEAYAVAQGISLGELIRRLLAERVEGQKSPDLRGERFFRRSAWAGDMATDVAARHDDYLYGSESSQASSRVAEEG